MSTRQVSLYKTPCCMCFSRVVVSSIFLFGDMIQFDDHIFQMGGSTTNQVLLAAGNLTTFFALEIFKAWKFGCFLFNWGSTPIVRRIHTIKQHDMTNTFMLVCQGIMTCSAFLNFWHLGLVALRKKKQPVLHAFCWQKKHELFKFDHPNVLGGAHSHEKN